MYEIIWSYREDCYVIRALLSYGNVSPKFVGTLEECQSAIKNFKA